MSRAVVAAYAACALIWGTTWYAIRVCIGPGAFGTLEALHPGRIDSNPRLQRVYRDAILDAGGVAVQLGRGEIIAIRLPELFAVFESLLGKGITIYDAELPDEPPTVPPQERVRG